MLHASSPNTSASSSSMASGAGPNGADLLSPISDQGYASSSSTPWMDNECDKFAHETSSPHHALLASPKLGQSTSSGSTPPASRLHSTKSSLSSSVSFSANRANLKRSNGGSQGGIGGNPFLTLSPAAFAGNSHSSIALSLDGGDDDRAGVGSGHHQMKQQKASFWDSAPYWLTLYFFFNLSLTLYNKIALASFPFPWTLTCIHSASASVGSYVAYRRGYFQRSAPLAFEEQLVLIAFSSLYTINIAVSNLSLNLVSVPLHQVVRSTTPLFTMLISIVCFGKSYLLQTYLSLVPVIFGVCLATYGDYSFTAWGLLLTLLGAVLAAVKGIATNRILVGRLKFHPLDLLMRMSPLAFGQCFVFSLLSGELSQVYERTFVSQTLTRGQWVSLLVNGAIAFGLNIVSFTANKKTGALTMSVAANVKQVLTIVLAVVIFNLVINGTNLLGIALTIVGGAYYSYVEYQSKHSSSKSSATLPLISPGGSSPHLSSLPGNSANPPFQYYEKLSPLPTQDVFPDSKGTSSGTYFDDNNSNNNSNGAAGLGSRDEDRLLETAAYHRKTNSLAAFRDFTYPKAKGQSGGGMGLLRSTTPDL